ncbi:hypothetical protein BDZ89DRAFT_206875 [Hymenopellis radicata]|nr:hypothetical protein BDZ89DRAFT_206875 [Hymenopellis radicata]
MPSFNNIFGDCDLDFAGYNSSVFGALPYPTPASEEGGFVTFYLTSFNPSVLNCTVLGPKQIKYFSIVTDPTMPTYTVLNDAGGHSIALVEWQRSPDVEMRGVLSKRKVGDWLKLNANKSARIMDVKGKRYFWVPEDQYINLYSSGSARTVLARICRGVNTIVLDMTCGAIRQGLLDTTIIATLLLQSGKNID